MTALYVFANAGLGLLSLFILAPVILLSGLWTPPEAMPEWLSLSTQVSPLRHYIDLAYGILLKGADIDILRDSILALVLVGGAIFALSVWRLKHQFG